MPFRKLTLLVHSAKLTALALIHEILSAAHARAQFSEGCALLLVLNENWAALNVALFLFLYMYNLNIKNSVFWAYAVFWSDLFCAVEKSMKVKEIWEN